MFAHIDPDIRIEWVAVSDIQLEDEWQHVDCCAAQHQPIGQPILESIDEDDWRPGRCIP
jgi:hypothetical protein